MLLLPLLLTPLLVSRHPPRPASPVCHSASSHAGQPDRDVLCAVAKNPSWGVHVNWDEYCLAGDETMNELVGPEGPYGTGWTGVTLDPSNSTVQVLALVNEVVGAGTIPTEFSALTGLTFLSLSFNDLVGTIPAEFSALITLQQLSLIDNQLSFDRQPTERLHSSSFMVYAYRLTAFFLFKVILILRDACLPTLQV